MKQKSSLVSWVIILSVFIFNLFYLTSCGSDPTGGVKLTAPSNLQAVANSSTQIDLTWSDNSNNEDGFKIERKTGVDGSYSEVATVGSDTTTYSDTNGLLSGTEYCYRVRAYNNRGNSDYSIEYCVSTPDNIPNDPTNLQAVAISSTQIDLTWSDNSNNEDGFKIERKDGTDGSYIEIASVEPDITTYSDTLNLKRNIDYFYRVKAYNSKGDSAYSNEAQTNLEKKVWGEYIGPGSGNDRAIALAIDSDGNIYVAGESAGSSTGTDYVTIKYDSNGNEIWQVRYNGPGNSTDIARSIVVDGNGNVYITGESSGLGTGSDFATVKYDTDGNELWITRHDGKGNSTDIARSIVVDGDGNVYITGESAGSGTGSDYATIKYDTNGNPLWTDTAKRYNGPSSGNDRAVALAIDNNGNIYVTGESVGSGTGSDYATIKYGPDGKEMWQEASRYNGPGSGNDRAVAIAVDNNGNVFVTGEAAGEDTGYDYYTAKYDTNGNELWDKDIFYNGPSGGNDRSTDIALDKNGNVYVTGESTGSGTGTDYATIKYDIDGRQLWVARYNGLDNGKDIARSIVVDDKGNVFVTGESSGSSTGTDYLTIKYDPNGHLLWEARFDGPVHGNDIARAITLDKQGNIIVTGESIGSGTGSDYATIKYDSNGKLLWEARFDGPVKGNDIARAIYIDGLDNIYVTGDSTGSGTGSDYATIKYDSNGKQVWLEVSRYNGPGNSTDIPRAITLDNHDNQGNIIVTGESIGSGTGSDYATIKYDSNGKLLWEARFDGPVKGNDFARDFALDNNGNVYVTGESNSGLSIDYITVKYDPSGKEVWSARYNGTGWGDDRAAAIALDSSGNVFVTGESLGSGTGSDYSTVKYTNNLE